MNIFRAIIFGYFRNAKLKGCIKFIEKNQTYLFGKGSDDCVVIKVRDWRFYSRLILNGDIGLGEAYFLGYFECEDLRALFEWFISNKEEIPGFNSQKKNFFLFEWTAIASRLFHKLRKNTKRGSRKNIKHHYDVSNDFYRIWLDETMTYSSAIFDEGMTLKEAQENKYRKICEKLEIGPEDRVLEIGSGWGAFSIFAVREYGCRVKTITISEEQFKLARARIDEAGLSEQIDISILDYRDLEGNYDKIVSIEMMEALGHEYLAAFVKKCEEVLKPGGRACFQCITYPDDEFEAYLRNNNYIKKYIFPGGELISLAQLEQIVESSDSLVLEDKESIGLDYAKTLRAWADNLQAHKEDILALGFSEQFYRMWYYYFVYCEAGFASRYLDDLHILVRKNE